MMDRRAFVVSLALGTLAAPRPGAAQPTRKMYRIGVVGIRATSDLVGPQPRSPSIKALLEGLGELGYIYGEHFVTEPRGAEGRPERFTGLAAELVRLQVDVIVAPGPGLAAFKQTTSTIPVVMAASDDPVTEGLVRSLGNPGGNFTGLSLQGVETTAKRLELLKELVPGPGAVAVIWHQASSPKWKAAYAAAQERGWKLQPIEIRNQSDIEGAFKAAAGARASALLVFAAGLLFPHARRVAELAARNRLPAMYELRAYVEAGGLVSYGADIIDIWRRASVFVDKILKGAKPGELPVEQPTKFELVLNLKTAKALGLTISPMLLQRADQVIE